MILHDPRRLGRRFVALTMAALMVVAASAMERAAAQAPAALTDLRFSLEGRLEGPSAILLVPQDKGYYRQEGLSVTLDEGTTAIDPITRVASGSHDMGIVDTNALIRYRDLHPSPPVKAIFMVYNIAPFSIVARKSRGITEPKDLEGKKLGAPLAGSTFAEWPLFAKVNDIDATKVSVEQVGVPVRAPMLAAGELDAALGYAFRVYVDLKDRGVEVDDIVLMKMADYGLKLYGSAIIVNPKFAAEHPQAVRGFLRAFLRGIKDTVKNPATALDSVLRRDDSTRKDVELERLQMAIRDNIVTPETRAHGFGPVDMARLDETIDQIALAYPFKAKPKAEDIFDPTFLPLAAERRMN